MTGRAILDAKPVAEDELQSPEPVPESDPQVIARLAALSPLEYDRVREAEAKRMTVRASTLDRMIAAARKEDAEGDDSPFERVEPWCDPINGAELLNTLSATVRRFIACDIEVAQSVSLWVVMSWLMDEVQIAPLAVITAPEKRCGKSQLLSLMGRLVRRPLQASHITPAATFRAIDAWSPTLLVDETDTFLRENEEMRGVINAGHTRDAAYVIRTVGDTHTPTAFNVWGAKALSGIGKLPDTLMDRAIVLELRRKRPNEIVDRIRHAEPGLFDDLRSQIARWAQDNAAAVRVARPQLPEELHDRAQDNWEPLLAIADLAGGDWPRLARSSARKLTGVGEPSVSTGVQLLADIRDVIERRNLLRIASRDLLDELCTDDEQPWGCWNGGKPMTARQLSDRLKGYGIRSKTVRIGYGTPKGYEREQFADAFERYLDSPNHPHQDATPKQRSNDGASSVADYENPLATTPANPQQRNTLDGRTCGGVAADEYIRNKDATPKPASDIGCCGVADTGGETPIGVAPQAEHLSPER